jgi:uncharacterized protein (DUF169 family)
MNTSTLRVSLEQLLGSMAEPVTVAFFDAAPAGVPRIPSAAPAGCAYWKTAAEGATFYTTGEDHLNCPIGAYTHGAELTADAEAQLHGMLNTMAGLRYLKMEEVPGIPRREQPLKVAVYAPLSKTEDVPDVVLLRGTPRQMMLLAEAAGARGLAAPFPIMGRPACAMIAAAANTGKATSSLGCIGNRVYTELPDGEFYMAVPGQILGELVESLGAIANANSELEKYHRARCAG